MTPPNESTRGHGTWSITTTIIKKDGSKNTDHKEISEQLPKED